MGREVRRVSLDFNWPLGEVWEGFLNPFYQKCPVCTGSRGYSDIYLMLEDFTRILLLAASESDLRPDNYYPIQGRKLFPKGNPKQWPWDTNPVEVLEAIAGDRMSSEDAWIIRRLARLNKHPGVFLSHRARYQWVGSTRRVVLDPSGPMFYPHPFLVEDYGIGDVGKTLHTFVRKLGCQPGFSMWEGRWGLQKAILAYHGYEVDDSLPDELKCSFCKGEGIHPDVLEDFKNWKPYDPPEGIGYQLWETTSEGSPISPVCRTPEELASWLSENKASAFGHETLSYEGWLEFIMKHEWAPSLVVAQDGSVMSSVEWVSRD